MFPYYIVFFPPFLISVQSWKFTSTVNDVVVKHYFQPQFSGKALKPYFLVIPIAMGSVTFSSWPCMVSFLGVFFPRSGSQKPTDSSNHTNWMDEGIPHHAGTLYSLYSDSGTWWLVAAADRWNVFDMTTVGWLSLHTDQNSTRPWWSGRISISVWPALEKQQIFCALWDGCNESIVCIHVNTYSAHKMAACGPANEGTTENEGSLRAMLYKIQM